MFQIRICFRLLNNVAVAEDEKKSGGGEGVEIVYSDRPILGDICYNLE